MASTSVSASALSLNALAFAHVSDLHLPWEPRLTLAQRFSKRQLSAWSWRRRQAVQRPEILAALRVDLQRHAPDHIVVTGDVTNFSFPGEFEAAARWFESIAPMDRISVVPGNHDALVRVPDVQSWQHWRAVMPCDTGWPYVTVRGPVAFIGLCSALPTAPLLASGRLGAAQLTRVEGVLHEQARAGRARVVLLHHPVVDQAVSSRKALRDRAALRAVIKRAGAELVLHGHAREARLEAVPGPHQSVPVLCVPSSSALPNARDAAARWHRVVMPARGQGQWAQVQVRQWSQAKGDFVTAARYELRLPDVE